MISHVALLLAYSTVNFYIGFCCLKSPAKPLHFLLLLTLNLSTLLAQQHVVIGFNPVSMSYGRS